MDKKKFLIRLIFLIFFIFLLNYLAMKFYWYSSIWYFDMPMHFLGGFWLGLASLYFFPSKNFSFKAVLKVFLIVLFVGLSWEIFEIIIDRVITGDLFNTLDTLSDICFDLSGGLFAFFILQKELSLFQKIWYTP